MNKKGLIKEVSKKTGIQKEYVVLVTESILDVISNELSKGERVTIINFGTFNVVDRKPKNVKIPNKDETMLIDAYKQVKFIAGKELKGLIDEKAI